MTRLAVKLLLLDADDRLLLIHSKDPTTQEECWYPVGGGVEHGESLQQAATREAFEETGLTTLPLGRRVWRRDHTYEFDGRVFRVHEEWLLHRVEHYEPVATQLSDMENRSIVGFRWWRWRDLTESAEIIFPPRLGELVRELISDGVPSEPIDISSAGSPATGERSASGDRALRVDPPLGRRRTRFAERHIRTWPMSV